MTIQEFVDTHLANLKSELEARYETRSSDGEPEAQQIAYALASIKAFEDFLCAWCDNMVELVGGSSYVYPPQSQSSQS